MPKRATSTSFKKGDPRINRDGRPKDSVSLSALARRIGHEVATRKDGTPVVGPDGRPVTVIETILRQWAQNPKQQGDFLDRAYGKVATPVDLGGTVKHEHKHDLSKLDDGELERLEGIIAKLEGNQE